MTELTALTVPVAFVVPILVVIALCGFALGFTSGYHTGVAFARIRICLRLCGHCGLTYDVNRHEPDCPHRRYPESYAVLSERVQRAVGGR